jgi:GMP synthase (glutamine-hydrolysing)
VIGEHPGRLVIAKAGSKLASLAAVAGDFEDWIVAGLGVAPATVTTVAVHQGALLPPPDTLRGALVTGSPAMVTEHRDWAERTAAWLHELVARDIPVLGICFGHQLLAHALGGRVADNPFGIEVGTVLARPTPAAADDPLFAALPDPFPGQASHTQAVLELPPGAVRLATTAADPNCAFRCGARAWGLQLHPEFDDVITRAFVAHHHAERGARFANDGRCWPSPELSALLARFGALCG